MSVSTESFGNPSLGGTRPQTPAEGRLRPPDLLQTSLGVSVSTS
ncbi:hypothetical protein [Trichocoleus sp. FACHB-262]|nr:hypothetical protein [Trichocoleus sp. FACHB-262]